MLIKKYFFCYVKIIKNLLIYGKFGLFTETLDIKRVKSGVIAMIIFELFILFLSELRICALRLPLILFSLRQRLNNESR